MLAAFLVSSAQVSHLSLASSLLTGGTCPQVPLRISQPLFKSISMLNSCWRDLVGGGGLDTVVADGFGGWWKRSRRYNELQLFHTADPPGWSTAPVVFSFTFRLSLSPPSPLLVWPFITLCSPLWLFFFYFLPRPSISLFFPFSFSVFDFHSPSTAQGMFSFQMRAKKELWQGGVCAFVCVCALGPSVLQIGERGGASYINLILTKACFS